MQVQGDARIGLDQNPAILRARAEEVERIRRAAGQGDASAQFNLGQMYSRGDGVPRSDAEALKWTGLAAEQGHAEAQ